MGIKERLQVHNFKIGCQKRGAWYAPQYIRIWQRMCHTVRITLFFLFQKGRWVWLFLSTNPLKLKRLCSKVKLDTCSTSLSFCGQNWHLPLLTILWLQLRLKNKIIFLIQIGRGPKQAWWGGSQIPKKFVNSCVDPKVSAVGRSVNVARELYTGKLYLLKKFFFKLFTNFKQ